MPTKIYVLTLVCSLGCLGMGITVTAAFGAPTRSDYVDQVDPVCKEATDANRGLLRGVNRMIAKGELGAASPRFTRAAVVLGETRRRIVPVPRPPADISRLARWLTLLRKQETLLNNMAAALQQGQRPLVQGLAQQLFRGARRINNVVIGFDFEYCRLNPADLV